MHTDTMPKRSNRFLRSPRKREGSPLHPSRLATEGRMAPAHHRGELLRSWYSSKAAVALPRRGASPVTLRTRTPPSSATVTTSPHLTSRPGAAPRTPLIRTCPTVASDAAALRVRTIRAFHSHRSIRCRSADTETATSAALLGVRFKLGLEGRKFGKRRVWIDRLL